MDAFDQVAREFGVAIVEDAAQAIGAEVERARRGLARSNGCLQFLSHQESERATGDAGIVTTTRPEMAEHMRRLRNHGSPRCLGQRVVLSLAGAARPRARDGPVLHLALMDADQQLGDDPASSRLSEPFDLLDGLAAPPSGPSGSKRRKNM